MYGHPPGQEQTITPLELASRLGAAILQTRRRGRDLSRVVLWYRGGRFDSFQAFDNHGRCAIARAESRVYLDGLLCQSPGDTAMPVLAPDAAYTWELTADGWLLVNPPPEVAAHAPIFAPAGGAERAAGGSARPAD